MATSTSIQLPRPDCYYIKHQTSSLGVLEIEQVLTVNWEGEAKGKGGLRISKKMGFLKDLLAADVAMIGMGHFGPTHKRQKISTFYHGRCMSCVNPCQYVRSDTKKRLYDH
jgi:hypothetical protein